MRDHPAHTGTAPGEILWEPSVSRRTASQVSQFISRYRGTEAYSVEAFLDLYRWSVAQPTAFWKATFDFCRIIHSKPANEILAHPDRMPGALWFPGAELNFAENLLRYRDDHPALKFWGESSIRRSLSYRELFEDVAQLASFMRSLGVVAGDRVAACVPNIPESVVCMLAAASIGAIWSSCSPDFGVPGVLDRFGQIRPKLFICADCYLHKGKSIETLTKAHEISRQIDSIEHVLVLPYGSDSPCLQGFRSATSYRDARLAGNTPKIAFAQLPFHHPLYIMYSSGTTGKPKCIVHGAGGTLLEQLKELTLHTDLTRQDRLFYQTTCGWMMWNWLVAGLATGATILLYDGAPFHEEGRILFRMAEEERISIFGTNAKFLSAVEKEGLKPREQFDLATMHTMLSTGSVLLPESFDFVYRDIKHDICLSSISGGTDILGCFALGSPLLPVRRGELQTRSLGLDIQVFNSQGESVVGEKGDLVCRAPFPSMPVAFWNDADGSAYRTAYFSRFPGTWTHGDYVELSAHGGMTFFGRSDAVLNPGGIRIGTAELYRQVELFPEVVESLVVGFAPAGDEQIVLFIRLKEGDTLTPELENRIRSTIRSNLTPFHVPRWIFTVSDIPRTRSNKIVELAVRDILHGREIKNHEALANPEVLGEYIKIAGELATK